MKSSAELSEAEARAVGHMMWLACICARKWIGIWDDKRPPRDISDSCGDRSLACHQILVLITAHDCCERLVR
jgi:hypothetical protein